MQEEDELLSRRISDLQYLKFHAAEKTNHDPVSHDTDSDDNKDHSNQDENNPGENNPDNRNPTGQTPLEYVQDISDGEPMD